MSDVLEEWQEDNTWEYEIDEKGDATILRWRPRGIAVPFFGVFYQGVVEVPGVLGGHRVTCIDKAAFSGFELPDGREGHYDVVLPESVSVIPEWAFASCSWLEGFSFPEGLREIGDYAFAGCDSLKRVVVPESVRRIGAGAFMDCTSLEEALLPSSIITIEEELFFRCERLGKVVLGSNVEVISHDAFAGCSNLSLDTLPESVWGIGDRAFEGVGQNNCEPFLRLPESLEEVGERAFADVGFIGVFVPRGVYEIGEDAFRYGEWLDPTVVVCPSGSYAATWCEKCDQPFSTTPWKYYVVYGDMGHTATAREFVFDTFEEYARVAHYEGNDVVVEVPCLVQGSVVFSLGVRCFADDSDLREVVLPASVDQVMDCAFYGCLSLERVVFPTRNPVEIAADAFALCDDVRVACIEGSFVWLWCEEHGVTREPL